MKKKPEFHGSDLEKIADYYHLDRKKIVLFGANVNPLGLSGQVKKDLAEHLDMKHARHMLEDKDKSVTEVAATLGYFNRKYFTTCFKEEFGMTPSEFQKSQHEE